MLSRRRALADLRAIARGTDGVGVVDIRDRVSNQLYQALLHHFGSLDAARTAAGVAGPQPRNRRWTEDSVIAELRRAHRARVRITAGGLAAAGLRGLANAALEICRGLPRARRLAGISEPAPPIIERVTWDEDTVIADIRELHREGKSLAYTKAPRKLVNAGRYRFGSWRGAVEVAGFDYDRVRLVRERYGRDELLALLRELAARAPSTTLAELHDHLAAEAWQREFGSIEEAARAAGLDDWPVRLLGPLRPADEVIAGIRARHRAGESLTSAGVERHAPRLHRSAIRQFGAWHAAITAAALPAAAVNAAIGTRHRWTKTATRTALRARHRSGSSMSPSALRADDAGLYEAAKRHLGYDAELAAREWGAPRLQRTWTKRAVIEALRESHRGGERPRPTVRATAARLFGSMTAAREAAGIPVLRTAWSDARVIDEIRGLGGRRPSGTLLSIAQRRFGSWRAALAAAGVAAQTRRWDEASIREALQARIDLGRPLDATAARREESSLFFAVTQRYGSFDRAVEVFARSGRLPPRQRTRGSSPGRRRRAPG